MLQCEHSAILSTFIKLPFVINIYVLSSFEWPLKTGFTVYNIANWQNYNSVNNAGSKLLNRVILVLQLKNQLFSNCASSNAQSKSLLII